MINSIEDKYTEKKALVDQKKKESATLWGRIQGIVPPTRLEELDYQLHAPEEIVALKKQYDDLGKIVAGELAAARKERQAMETGRKVQDEKRRRELHLWGLGETAKYVCTDQGSISQSQFDGVFYFEEAFYRESFPGQVPSTCQERLYVEILRRLGEGGKLDAGWFKNTWKEVMRRMMEEALNRPQPRYTELPRLPTAEEIRRNREEPDRLSVPYSLPAVLSPEQAGMQLAFLAKGACAASGDISEADLKDIRDWWRYSRYSLVVTPDMGLFGCSYDLYIEMRSYYDAPSRIELNAGWINNRARELKYIYSRAQPKPETSPNADDESGAGSRREKPYSGECGDGGSACRWRNRPR